MDIRHALARIADGQNLSTDEMTAAMRQIMTGAADEAQIGAFLLGMRMKGETIDEITGAVGVMRELATGVTVQGEHMIDIVGTGGDGANLFNISTAACFVARPRVRRWPNTVIAPCHPSPAVLICWRQPACVWI